MTVADQTLAMGCIVHYRLNEQDAKDCPGYTMGQLRPAIVLTVSIPDRELCELQVFMGMYVDRWHTLVSRGDEPGQWDWPARTDR